MGAVVRILVAVVLWTTPLLLIMRLIYHNFGLYKSIRLMLYAFLMAIVAIYFSISISLSITKYEFQRLFRSSLLQMDISRVIETSTCYWKGNYRTNVHPLQPMLSQPISYVLTHLTDKDNFRVAQLTCILLLSLSTALLFLTIYGSTSSLVIAFIGTIGYIASFSYFLLSAFPESSSMAAPTVILPYLIYIMCKNKTLQQIEILSHIAASVLTFGITITNFIHSVIVYLLRMIQIHSTNGARRVVSYLLCYITAVLALNGVLSILQRKALFYLGSAYWFHPSALLGETRWLSIWWDGWMHPLRTLLQMVVYPIVGPPVVFSDIGCRIERYPILQLSAESASIHDFDTKTVIIILIYLLFLMYIIWQQLKIKENSTFRVIIAGIIFQILLHIIYGNELLLYAGNWLPIFWLGIATATAVTQKWYNTFILLIIIIVIFLHNNATFTKFKNIALKASNYAIMQIPITFPNKHEFARTYINWIGQFSPGIGASSSIIIDVFDIKESKSNILTITKWDSISHSLYNGFIPFPSIRSIVGNLQVHQVWYPVLDGVLVKLSIASKQGQYTVNRARVYLLVGLPGVTSSRFKAFYTWNASNRCVLCRGRVMVRCSISPNRIVYHEDPGQLFNMAICGRQNTLSYLSYPMPSNSSGNDISVRASSQALLLSWDIELAPHRKVDLWFHCPYSMHPVDESGKPLHEVVNLPEYHPVSRNYGPLTYEEIQSYLHEAEAFWRNIFGHYELSLPDKEWSEGFWGAAAHLIQSIQQDGRIPVTPINYGVFTRDAAYMIYALLVAGQTDYARQAIEYLLQHPWEGRPYPEGDSPGHILWAMYKYWRYSRDKRWLQEKLPQIVNLAEGILQMRSNGLSPAIVNILGHYRIIPADPSAALALQQRAGRQQPFVLNYGKMDQAGLLYVNSVSLYGLRGAIEMLRAANAGGVGVQIEKRYSKYLQEFLALLKVLDYQLDYDERGHCFAAWPAELHLVDPKIRDFFLQRNFDGKVATSVWRYLDMDYAHNMLAAGKRNAGYEVVERYLALPAFRSWKLLDEGGPSSEGYWNRLSNKLWDPQVAVPHGWSLASLCLLIRDCIVREEGNRLVLLSGVPSHWLADGRRIHLILPTEYGEVRVVCIGKANGIQVKVDMQTPPSGGIWLHLPDDFVSSEVCVPVGKEVFIARKQ